MRAKWLSKIALLVALIGPLFTLALLIPLESNPKNFAEFGWIVVFYTLAMITYPVSLLSGIGALVLKNRSDAKIEKEKRPNFSLTNVIAVFDVIPLFNLIVLEWVASLFLGHVLH